MNTRRYGLLGSLTVLGALASVAHATSVGADLSDSFNMAAVNQPGATVALFASSSVGPTPAGTNSDVVLTTEWATITGGQSSYSYTGGAPATTIVNGKVHSVAIRDETVPAYTSQNPLSKPTAYQAPGGNGINSYLLWSHSNYGGPFKGSASAYLGGSIKALAQNTSSGRSGSAAGAAFDPFTFVSTATLAYTPSLDASVQIDPGDSGGLTIFTYDSTTCPNPDDEGGVINADVPLSQMLWELSMDPKGSGPMSHSSDLSISFQLNPAALNELSVPGIAGPSDTAGIAAFESQVEAAVANSLTFTGGEADLTAFNPFPSNTTYTPADPNVEFGDGVEAAIAAVPEPASGSVLLLFGVAGLLARRTRSRISTCF